MKTLILIIALLAFTSEHELALESTPLDVVKCLLQSETLMKDFSRVIELVKEGDYFKLLLELIEMYPAAYEEVKKCLPQEINLESSKLARNCQLDDKDSCCWVNRNGCCKPPTKGQMCTQALTTCCKRKVVDVNGKVHIEYYRGRGNPGTDVM